MSVVGLDWNATRALAVLGAAGGYALPVSLEPPSAELPMLLDLAGAQPIVGGAARRRCRTSPHQICHGFLAHLGAPARTAPAWKIGRRPLDAEQAAGHVWQKLHGLCRSAKGVVLAVPGYFQPAQAELLRALGTRNKVAVLGSVPLPLAAALAGHVQHVWSRAVLVVDVDDHALTVALVLAGQDRAHLVETRAFPSLGLRAWQDRLINAFSDLCVWQTRRDPRDAPPAEQGLFDQLDALIDACLRRHPIQLAVQSSQWYHHLLVQSEQTLAFCSPLASQAAREVEALGNIPPADEAPPAILMTHQAGRLPGLRGLLTALAQAWAESPDAQPIRPRTPAPAAADDFGEDLLFDDAPESVEHAAVAVLAPEGPARAAHSLAEALRIGQPTRGHLASVAPLPLAESVETGPARLHFQGRDHLLHGGPFTLGTQAGCSLLLDAHEHPQVADRHCDIVFDRRTFLVFNRSNHGTLVNDTSVVGSFVLRAGDRIRLGAQGPVLRFLGDTPARIYTTA
jgi:hypothetical protein